MLSLRQPKHWASSGVTFIMIVWDSASRMAAQPAKLTAPASATTPILLRVILIMFVDAIPRAIGRHHIGGSLMEGSRRGIGPFMCGSADRRYLHVEGGPIGGSIRALTYRRPRCPSSSQ